MSLQARTAPIGDPRGSKVDKLTGVKTRCSTKLEAVCAKVTEAIRDANTTMMVKAALTVAKVDGITMRDETRMDQETTAESRVEQTRFKPLALHTRPITMIEDC